MVGGEPGAAVGAVTAEEQNSDYESGLARIGEELWRIRTARVTPTKPGAFVALWRRNAIGETEPFPASETAVAGALIFVSEHHDGTGRTGVFRFTRDHLSALGVLSSPARPGKRGFRVYPPWAQELNRQAARTQAAQAAAFVAIGRWRKRGGTRTSVTGDR